MTMRSEKEIRTKRNKLLRDNMNVRNFAIQVLDWVLKEDPATLMAQTNTKVENDVQHRELNQYREMTWQELTKKLGPKKAKEVKDRIENEKSGQDSKEDQSATK